MSRIHLCVNPAPQTVPLWCCLVVYLQKVYMCCVWVNSHKHSYDEHMEKDRWVTHVRSALYWMMLVIESVRVWVGTTTKAMDYWTNRNAIHFIIDCLSKIGISSVSLSHVCINWLFRGLRSAVIWWHHTEFYKIMRSTLHQSNSQKCSQTMCHGYSILNKFIHIDHV